ILTLRKFSFKSHSFYGGITMRAEHVRANKRVIGPDDLCHERLIATLTSVTPTLDVVLCAPITSANPSVSTLMDIAAQT
ncbi:hypothetical protein, partial [Acetobacter estunensis]|uniref:hypothetical protein n=1 Tax=Acetobacter estunensis TaxID=104097 RepID=UPI002230B13A